MGAVKTIIITGGGGHLGQCVARWWVKPGRHLVLIDRDAQRLEKARADLAPCGAELTLLATDLAVPDDLRAAAASLGSGRRSSLSSRPSRKRRTRPA